MFGTRKAPFTSGINSIISGVNFIGELALKPNASVTFEDGISQIKVVTETTYSNTIKVSKKALVDITAADKLILSHLIVDGRCVVRGESSEPQSSLVVQDLTVGSGGLVINGLDITVLGVLTIKSGGSVSSDKKIITKSLSLEKGSKISGFVCPLAQEGDVKTQEGTTSEYKEIV